MQDMYNKYVKSQKHKIIWSEPVLFHLIQKPTITLCKKMSCKETDFCGIPEDILDGIHPNEEDFEKVIAVDCCCKNSQKSAIISIDELMIKRDSEKRPPLIQKSLNVTLPSKSGSRSFVMFLRCYSNYHISSLFIVTLSLLNSFISVPLSVLITTLVISTIVVLDQRYSLGIGNV